jgi:hypothetical protein
MQVCPTYVDNFSANCSSRVSLVISQLADALDYFF